MTNKLTPEGIARMRQKIKDALAAQTNEKDLHTSGRATADRPTETNKAKRKAQRIPKELEKEKS